MIYSTSEVLQDTTALAAIIGEAFPDQFAFMVDDAIFEGSGTAQPLGFMNANCKVTVAKETGQPRSPSVREHHQHVGAVPGAFDGDRGMVDQPGCVAAAHEMSMVIGTGGVPVYLPPGGLSQSPYGTLMSRPVIPIEYCNTLGTEGDIVLADPSQYVMIDKGDIRYAPRSMSRS